MGPTELYVYYKLSDAQAEAAARVFETAAAALPAWPELELRLLKRLDAGGAQQTWMEIYRGPQADEAQRLMALAMQVELDSPRHLERFAPVWPQQPSVNAP